jgi:prepilin peptidase CpaA
MVELLVLTVFPAAMIAAALCDLTSMTLPNRLAVGLTAAFFIIAPLAGVPALAMLWHMLVGLAALAVGMALFAPGWIGGGDAKFGAAVALWVGPSAILPYFIVAALAGGALTLLILMFRRLPLPAPIAAQGWIARLHDHREGVPYGIALALGGLVVFPQTLVFTMAAA